MSNFIKKAIHPETNKLEEATFLDGYFGSREYGVLFPDGKIFREEYVYIPQKETKVEPIKDVIKRFREKFLIERKDSESQEFKEKVNDYLISELEQFIEKTTKEAEDKGYAEGVRYTEKKYQSKEKFEPKENELSLKGKIVKMVAEQLNNVCNLQKVEPLINDIEKLLISQKKECKHILESGKACCTICNGTGFVEQKETLDWEKDLKEWWKSEEIKWEFMEQHSNADFDKMFSLIKNKIKEARESAKYDKDVAWLEVYDNEIKKVKSQLIKEIEEMKKRKLKYFGGTEEVKENDRSNMPFSYGYNQALEEIQTLLKT